MTQSKRITQLDCTIFLRFWLAQIAFILVLVSVTNTLAAVIHKREIPTSFPQKEVSDTLLSVNKEINRQIEVNEPKSITLSTTEFPLNQIYKNDSRKFNVLLPKTTYSNSLYRDGSTIETTTRGALTVTELYYNDINAKYEVVNNKNSNEHNNLKSDRNEKIRESKQSKEALKIFDNDILQILGAVNKKDLTMHNPFRTEDGIKNSNRQIKNKSSPSAEEIKTLSIVNSDNSITLNKQTTTEISTNIQALTGEITQNGKDLQMKSPNSFQDIIDTEILNNHELIRDTVTEITTIKNNITKDTLFDLGTIQGLSTLPTITISTDKLDNTTPNNSIIDSIENRHNRQYDRSLNIHDNFTLHISRNVNENEIITTEPTTTKLDTGTSYTASKKKYVASDKSTTEKATTITTTTTTATTTETSSLNMEKRGKYIDNNSTITQQINLPSAAEIWSLVGMKSVSKINATMGTTHEHFSKVNKNEKVSPTLNGHNSEKAILDWSQVVSTKKIKEITTEHKVLTSSVSSSQSPPISTSTMPIIKIITNEMVLNETTANPKNIMHLKFNNGDESIYNNNNTRSLSARQNIKSSNLSVNDNSEEKQIMSPILLENNTENIIEANIEITTIVTPTIQTGTEIETETETSLTTLNTSTSEEMKLSEENETTIHPPTTSVENVMILSKMEKVEQQDNDKQIRQQQMNFENDANTTIKNIIDDAVTEAVITTTITDSQNVDTFTFTLQPTASETTTFSTLITGESNASVSPSVITIHTPFQSSFTINNQNYDTTTKATTETTATTTIEINSSNTAAPTNSSTNNVNKIYNEGTADIDRYINKTNLEKTKKNQTTNLATNFIETVKATTAAIATTTLENNFNSNTFGSHLISQVAETTTIALETTTIIKGGTVNSVEFFSTLPTETEREAMTTTIIAIRNTEETPTGNDSTSFPETKSTLINQDYNNEHIEEETHKNITLNETSFGLNINEMKPTTQAALIQTVTIAKPTNIITTTTEKTPVASTNFPHLSETSIETNIIDNNNNNNNKNNNTNTESKIGDGDIEKTITYTLTPFTIARPKNVTESSYNKYNGNDNVLMKTTMSSRTLLNNTTSQMTIDIGHRNSNVITTKISTAATTRATITTPKSEMETTTLSPARLMPKIEEIYNVIQHSTTEKSIQDVTTLSQPGTLSTNQQNFIESSTSSIINEIKALPKPTIENIHQTDTNNHEDGYDDGSVNAGDGTGIGGIILPTLRTIENDRRHLYPSKASDTTDETDINVIIAITVSVIGVVALVLLVAFLYLMRKRQKSSSYSQRCRPVSLDDYTIDSTSIYNSMRHKGNTVRASKRSHANLAFDDPLLRHNVLDANELGKFLQDKCSIYEEFRDVPQVRARVDEVPSGCEDKNRYANVVPLPETRVMLQRLNDDAKTEYINANYVRGPKDAIKYYIACQAPLDSTIEDFWRMIWEQKSRVIIQATDLVENGVEKCAEYLPPSMTLDNHTTFGEFQVTLHHREVKDKYATSIILLKHIGENMTREITHYWYKWPEVGVPLEEAPIIAMLLEARSSLISYAIEYANEVKEDTSTITLKSTEDSSAATINSTNGHTKDKESANGTMNNMEEINGNISMVHIRKKTAKYQGPLTVHCSPGTGRTGTIIACDIAIRSLEMPKRTVDIPQIVYYVRHGRASSVLTKEQYEFIYKVANMYATKITYPSNDN